MAAGKGCDRPMLKAFDILRSNVRERPITFMEAMNSAF